MKNDQGTVVYNYGGSTLVRLYIANGFAVFVTFVTFVGLIADLSNSGQSSVSSDWPPPWGSLFGFIAAFGLLAVTSNVYPSIRISTDGISVKTFRLWWVMVPWQDILSVRNSIIGGSRHKIIIVRRLTLIHHIFGLMYGFTTKPAFQLTSELNGFQEIMKVIKQKTEGQIES